MAPSEGDIQAAVFDWLKRIYPGGGRRPLYDYAFAVPNGAVIAGDAQQRARYMAAMKRRGWRPGVSDIMIAYPIITEVGARPLGGTFAPPSQVGLGARGILYPGMFLELKRDKKSRPTQAQLDWLALMREVGYYVALATGFAEAEAQIRNYLLGGRSDFRV